MVILGQKVKNQQFLNISEYVNSSNNALFVFGGTIIFDNFFLCTKYFFVCLKTSFAKQKSSNEGKKLVKSKSPPPKKHTKNQCIVTTIRTRWDILCLCILIFLVPKWPFQNKSLFPHWCKKYKLFFLETNIFFCQY